MDRCSKCNHEDVTIPLHFKFKMIGEGFKQRFNNELKKYDLTFSQFGIICFLQEHQDEKIYIKKLGEVFNLTHPTVVGIINRLEEKGFVETRQDEENKRYRIITLSAKGAKLKANMDRGRDEMDRRILRGFSAEEKAELIRLLDKVIGNIDNDEKGEKANGKIV